MRFERIFLNRLQDQQLSHDTVVVIDVLRSFTTAAIALARGASAVYPVDGIASAWALSADLEDSVTVGAIAGGDPVPGFAYGNSPSALEVAMVAGKPVVLTTAAGVRGLQRFRDGKVLYAASMLCAAATARAIRQSGASDVCFVITGEWVDRDGDEDIACADYIEALLRDERVNPAAFGERVRQSDFGRRFLAGTNPSLPIADLELAATVDRFDFAMPVVLDANGHMVIRR